MPRLDFGQADGRAFLVMELARGSLRDELGRVAAAARTLAARLADARAVASGLAAVHAAGVVHRDVTPQNVLRMSDGRLVVSDFGLATDASPENSSLRGGTLAYMAPEIARGEHATFASDVWALGAIVHEIVFGRRPCWREGRFGPTFERSPDGPLGPVERRVSDLCRRCMVELGRRRPSAHEVSRLVENAAADPRPRGRARRLAVAAGLAGTAALVAAFSGGRHVGTTHAIRPLPSRNLLAAYTGEAADWTRDARVLATFDGRVHGVTTLPGGRNVRVVWGDPRRAEDVDVLSGARKPVALAALPERSGPPVPSPDGRATAVEGYDGHGRPFIFLESAERGDRPVAVSAAADPSLASEPRWLAGGRAFVYDADVRNVGVFSLDTNRGTILPAFEVRASFTTFKAAVHDRVLVARITEDMTSQIAIFSWPAMAIVARFDVDGLAVEWQSTDGRTLHGIAAEHGGASEIVELALGDGRVRRLGAVPGQSLRALARAGRELVFASFRFGGDVWLDGARGGRAISHDLHARQVARGGGRLLVTVREGGEERIVELDEQGRTLGPLTTGPSDESPSILPDGRAWTYVRRAGAAPGFYRCEAGRPARCVRALDLVMPYATVSPDGKRIAYVDPAPQGTRARLIGFAGGTPRELGDASSYCAPVWSSAHTVWISRRTEGTPEWVETEVDGALRPTGRRQAGARDCTDGLPDPAAPVRDGAKILVNWRSELRAHEVAF